MAALLGRLRATTSSKKKKTKLRDHSMLPAVVGLTEEDQLLSLMDEMTAASRGWEGEGAVLETGAESEPEPVRRQTQKQKCKRPRLDEEDAAEAVLCTPGASAASAAAVHDGTQVDEEEEEEDYSTASPHELWCPGVRVTMDRLNLTWWGTGGSAAVAPAPRFPAPEPRVEVARFQATQKLRARLLHQAADPDSDLDEAPTTSSKSKSNSPSPNKALDRAFHRWLRACKAVHDPMFFSTTVPAAIDPVLPSRPACQRDLPLAQALINQGLGVEATAEACEALGKESVATAAALASGRYGGEEAGEERVGGKKRRKGPSSLDPAEGLALHPLSRLEQPPVLRSRHHRPCLYLPLSAPALGERLACLERNEAVEVSLLKGRALRVNDVHFLKLRALYSQHHLATTPQRAASSSSSLEDSKRMSKAEEALFHERVGCLLFRYQALAAEAQQQPPSTSGAWERLERSLPPRVFDALDRLFGARFECFASPFNCRYPRYCSSQWDVDGFFGSLGPFQLFEPLEGTYIAHPPAVPEVVEAAMKHMLRLLARTARPLTFLLVVPGESGNKGKQPSPSPSSSLACVRRLLLGPPPSPFLAWSLALAPGEYGLVRGDQHFRPRRLVAPEKREGLLLLSLQSKATRAAGRQALTPAKERALRQAFGSFEAENGRDMLAPPPSDITLPASQLEREGKHEWWW